MKQIQGLQSLKLEHTEGDGRGCGKRLTELKGLRYLDLTSTKVTDVGVKELTKCRGLQTLHLSGTQVTDAGLKELKNVQGPQTLTIGTTEVTDAGIKELAELTETSL